MLASVITSNSDRQEIIMRHRAFRTGFAAGFASPFIFFVRSSLKDDKYRVSVDDAIRDVGEAFVGVMKREGALIGDEKADRKTRKLTGEAA
jgi:hypothetical protein